MLNFTIIGNITKDVEPKKVGENYVYNISVAINRKYKDNNQTTFVNVNYWSKSEKLAQYLTKGKKVALIGNWYENREHEGKYYQSFFANELELLGGNDNTQKTAPKTESKPQSVDELLEDDGDLPF